MTRSIEQPDVAVSGFCKCSPMKLQRKREALTKLNRRDSESDFVGSSDTEE